MPSDKIKRSNASRESDSRTETKPVEADHRDVACSHIATVIPAAAWITFDESDLNDAAGVDLGPASHVKLLDALDQYRAVQSIPPLPPFSEIEKRLSRLANKPEQFEKILQIKYGEYPRIDQRKFRTSRQNVNYHVGQLLLAAGADLTTPPSHEQIVRALENAEVLHRAARSDGVTTSGRADIPGRSDLITSAIEVQRDAGGTGPVWRWDSFRDMYEGFLYDLMNFLLGSNLLVDHLQEIHCAAPPSQITQASWTLFSKLGFKDPVISEETVQQLLRKSRR
ncbi:MAG: hypothetical protein RQ826_15900 [Xanthomonadales bacterium]|nr:hypothetical protein [Xanthomonadales bacterium]